MSNRLRVGIDFSLRQADLCLMRPDGQLIESDCACSNNLSGYARAKQLLLDALENQQLDGLDVSGEATSYYWLPFFLQLAADPDLAPHDPKLFLLNPRWVKWYKKSCGQADKSDQTDPYYIADYLRSRRPQATWSPELDILPLRLYTRCRFHLMQNLVREKCFLSAYLFLKASAYGQIKPFADIFGATSGLVLCEHPTIGDLAKIPLYALASDLFELARHHLPDPLDNATKLQTVARESFPMPQPLVLPLQRILEIELAHIRFLEQQIAQVDEWIADEATAHPAVACLDSIPGIGPVFASGIAAEIGDVHAFLNHPKWDRQRKRYRPCNLRDAEDAISKLAGLWWPRNDSGDFEAEDRRLAKSGNHYLRYYLIEGADCMRQHIRSYTEFYARKHREVPKHKHMRALVLTARKSVGLHVGLLHRGETWRSEEG